MSQVVVVTGGAGGIGSAICRALGEDGHNVVVADFNEAAAQKLAGDIGTDGGQALAVGVDVGDKASVDGMIAAAIEQIRTHRRATQRRWGHQTLSGAGDARG